MEKIKILGAGSIGNHMANAARSLGWSVDICDTDPAALKRTKNTIYPGRYGAWDEAIGLHEAAAAPTGGYDMIIIGTPPDAHLPLAMQAMDENPKAILIEKPVSTPESDLDQAVFERAERDGIRVFVGYDHVVGAASQRLGELATERHAGDIETLDVEFREYWGGIFAAHPWLDGPADSYLGYWKRGGGALGEHSHALNLWQHIAHTLDAGRVVEVSAMLELVNDGKAEYDKLAALHLRSENGLSGRVIQDVVTRPTRKWARLQGRAGYLEWSASHKPGMDVVIRQQQDTAPEIEEFPKTRPDDFITELRHIEDAVDTGRASPLDLARGLDTMRVIAAAHLSSREKRTVFIDYAQGYTPAALA